MKDMGNAKELGDIAGTQGFTIKFFSVPHLSNNQLINSQYGFITDQYPLDYNKNRV